MMPPRPILVPRNEFELQLSLAELRAEAAERRERRFTFFLYFLIGLVFGYFGMETVKPKSELTVNPALKPEAIDRK